MLSHLRPDLPRVVRTRPLVSVAVGGDRYSVGYSPRIPSLEGFDCGDADQHERRSDDVSTFPLVTLNPLGSLSDRARSGGHDPLPGSRYQRASAASRAKTLWHGEAAEVELLITFKKQAGITYVAPVHPLRLLRVFHSRGLASVGSH
jgi:hypothetical protein